MTEAREGFSPKPKIKRKPTQLVFDPDVHIKHYVTPELAKRPTEKRNARIKRALDEATLSKLSQPNPLERRTR